MVYLRVKVECSHCRIEVEKTEARRIKSVDRQARYQCFKCFKKNRPMVWGFGDKVTYKKEFFCLRCKYRYKSKSDQCPYCNRNDSVIRGNLTVHDLL